MTERPDDRIDDAELPEVDPVPSGGMAAALAAGADASLAAGLDEALAESQAHAGEDEADPA